MPDDALIRDLGEWVADASALLAFVAGGADPRTAGQAMRAAADGQRLVGRASAEMPITTTGAQRWPGCATTP